MIGGTDVGSIVLPWRIMGVRKEGNKEGKKKAGRIRKQDRRVGEM